MWPAIPGTNSLSDIAQLHIPAQPGQEILHWKEASKQQQFQGGGALLGAGCSKIIRSDVARRYSQSSFQ